MDGAFTVSVSYIPIPGGVVLHFGEDDGSTTLLPGVQLEYDLSVDNKVVNVRLADDAETKAAREAHAAEQDTRTALANMATGAFQTMKALAPETEPAKEGMPAAVLKMVPDEPEPSKTG
jgi:hypothetical protein